MTVKALRGLSYLGGKSAGNAAGSGTWIASLLPPTTDCLYVEPFAGMCGVLLQRPRARQEIVNDIDEALVTWWRVLQVDHGRERLVERLRYTPRSRAEFTRAIGCLDGDDPIDVAWAVSVMLLQGVQASLNRNARPSDWRRAFGVHVRPTPMRLIGERIEGLAERMERVQIECGDGVKLIERVATESHTVMYVDPPYPSAPASANYGHGADTLDVDRMTAALAAQTGRVVLSGYGDEWNALGWERHTYSTRLTVHSSPGQPPPARTEVAWTNFDITEHQNTIEQGVLL